jgi:beta-glucanase (GH16 family)
MNIWSRLNLTYDQGEGLTLVYDPLDEYYVPNDPWGIRLKAKRISSMVWHSGGFGNNLGWSFQYGYAEIIAKLPKGKGLWPAFFLFTDTQEEIDVFEMIDVNCKNLMLSTHTTGNSSTGNFEYQGNVDLSLDYHRYGITWDSSIMEWWLDGERIWYQTTRIPTVPMKIYLALSVGGWAGNPDENTPDPAYFDIKSLKIWQKI